LEDETRAAEMISGCRSSNRFTKLDGELRSIDMELVMVKKKKILLTVTDLQEKNTDLN
jgi:hypothetical protein